MQTEKVTDNVSDRTTSPSAESAEVELCAGCHLPLTKTGPSGECLRCLMGFALSQDWHVSAKDLPRKPWTSGATRYGHFELIVGEDGCPVELGAGAMAVT